MSLLALAAALPPALAVDITITDARTYDGTMAGAGLIIDGAVARLTIPAGSEVTTLVDLRNGGTVDNAGTIARTGANNRGVVGGSGRVINRDGGQITAANATGILLYEGGSVDNSGSNSLIRGGFRGIAFQGAMGVVTNSGGAMIESTNEAGIYFDSGGRITNGSGSTIRSASTAIRTFGETTVENYGLVAGGTGDGVSIESGTVTNAGTQARIEAGDTGVFVDFGGEVTNTAGASIEGVGHGVVMNYGGNVSNSGGASIRSDGVGVLIWDYGTLLNSGAGTRIDSVGVGVDLMMPVEEDSLAVVNQDGAVIDGGYAGLRFAGTGTVNNTGAASTISANAYAISYEYEAGDVTNSAGARIVSRVGSGIAFSAGGRVENLDGAKVDGKVAGVYSVGGATQVVNSGTGSVIAGSAQGIYTDSGLTLTSSSGGTIQGGQIGVYLFGGGSITNEAGATISGVSAIHAFGSTTLVNQGRLEGKVLLERTAHNTVTLWSGSLITGDLEIGDHSSSSLTLTGTGSQLYSEAVLGDTSFASKLIKKGSGTWIVDKAIDATIVNIDEGTLIIGVGGNGEVVGTVNVNPGSRLTGSGKVYGNVIVDNATVAPGNSPGVLNIIGGYAPGAGSVYEAEIDPANVLSDRIDVTGNAVIGAGAELRVIRLNQSPWVAGTRYTVLTSTGLSGAFTLTGDIAPSAFLSIDDEYDYTADNVYLVVQQSRALASAALTPNQSAVAAALDAAASGPARNAALNAADDAAARAAFDALSGEVHAALRGTLLLDAGRIGGIAIDALRGDEQLWARTLGVTGRIAGDGNGHEVLNTTGGFLFGGDLPVAEHLRLGLLAGVVGHGASVAGSSADITSYTLGLYGAAELGDFAFRFGASTEIKDIRTRSTIGLAGIGNASAAYAGWTTQAFVEAAHGIDLGPLTLEPFAGISLAGLSTGGFSETGTGLAAASATSTLATSTIGLRASGVIDLGGNELELDGSLGWRHVIAGSPNTMTGSYDGAAFTITGAPLPMDTLDVGLGGTLALSENASLGLRYSGSFSANATSHAVTGSFKVSF